MSSLSCFLFRRHSPFHEDGVHRLEDSPPTRPTILLLGYSTENFFGEHFCSKQTTNSTQTFLREQSLPIVDDKQQQNSVQPHHQHKNYKKKPNFCYTILYLTFSKSDSIDSKETKFGARYCKKAVRIGFFPRSKMTVKNLSCRVDVSLLYYLFMCPLYKYLNFSLYKQTNN